MTQGSLVGATPRGHQVAILGGAAFHDEGGSQWGQPLGDPNPCI
jgi:hypothetical protein